MRCRNPIRPAPRSGFTLIEMLVVLFVLLILMLLGFTVVNANTKHEKIAGASRHLRSFLEGARDRAIHSRQPRGVRLLQDSVSPEPGVYTSMVYIGPAGKLSEGTITVGGNRRTLTSVPAVWTRLWQRDPKLVPDGSRLRIGLNVYTIVKVGASWQLTRPVIGRGGRFGSGQWDLELGPMVLPNQEPRALEGNAVVKILRGGRDVMFSPRGTIIGAAARLGHVHLLVTSHADHKLPIGSPAKEDAEVLVTVKTQNGSVSAHSVVPGDVFRNAETGVETE
ncbi:MAG: prepilin-type N-terminal cleavage/methylation domain-containing protein [Planctomycetaceae bacterium]